MLSVRPTDALLSSDTKRAACGMQLTTQIGAHTMQYWLDADSSKLGQKIDQLHGKTLS